MMCSYVTCFSYFQFQTPHTHKREKTRNEKKKPKNPQGKRKDSQTNTWYLRKFHFPMELIRFIIIISIPVFSKIAHQRTLVSPRHRDAWQALEKKARYFAIWQGCLCHEQRCKDARGSPCKCWTSFCLKGREGYQRHQDHLLWHAYTVPGKTLELDIRLPQQYKRHKEVSATVWKEHSWTRVTGESFSAYTAF